jgi:hypothetical protein
MAISELTSAVRPPSKPFEAGPRDQWERIQRELGTPLPSDLRDFGLTYGTGMFKQGICVFNPFAAVFLDQMEEAIGCWRSLKEAEGEEEVPFEVFPDTPGLFSWGCGDQGEGLFWLTEGSPEEWPVIIRGRDEPIYHRFDMQMTSFLAKLLTRKIVVPDLWTGFDEPANRIFESQRLRRMDRNKLKSVYQLYVERGNRADFYVQHENWRESSTVVHIKTIGGKADGPLSGDAPDFGEPIVIGDVYEDGAIFTKDDTLTIGADRGFQLLENPDCWASLKWFTAD